MAPTNRLPVSGTRKLAVALFAVFGGFLLFCGAGMASPAVVGLGVLLAIGGPALIVAFALRNNLRRYVYGTAVVNHISPPPTAGSVGRCLLELNIKARGIDNVVVSVRDPAVPVNKWPDRGATLPVQVVQGNPRKVTILWAQVRTHSEAAFDDRHGATDEEMAFDHGALPPDDRPTVTNLPPITEPVSEDRIRAAPTSPPPATVAPGGEQRGGEGVVVAQRIPSTPVAGGARRKPSPRPRRPANDRPPTERPRLDQPAEEPSRVATLVGSVGVPSSYAIPEGGAVLVDSPGAAQEHSNEPDPPAPDQPERDQPERDQLERDQPERDQHVPDQRGSDPADELEAQPLTEGAIAHFLAATPRRHAVALDGVNGVSVTLIVSDLQRSRRFYRDVLGLAELDSSPGSAVLASGEARVVLRRVADMPPVDRRVVHLNLEVPDVYEAYERLREQGVEFVHRPRVVPQGEQLELCSATFRDPDGHAIALTRWELRR